MEQESGSPGKGQTLTEQILQIMEVILMEASSETPEKYKVIKRRTHYYLIHFFFV